MTRTKFKKIPFDIKLAKKITNKKVKGRIVTRDGRQARIISLDKGYTYPMTVLIEKEEESRFYCEKGSYFGYGKNNLDLHIEIPTYYKDYSNFKPQRYQPYLVRNDKDSLWGIQVYAYTDYQGKMLFYDDAGHLRSFSNCLPISKTTKRLLGTNKSYEDLIKELDAKQTSIIQDAEFEDDKQFNFHEIKTFEDACKKLGISIGPLIVEAEAFFQATALYKLLIIQKAINNGIYRDKNGWSYYPYWVFYSKKEMERMSEEEKQKNGIKQLLSCASMCYTDSMGVRYAGASIRGVITPTHFGFPLCFNSEEAAKYAAKQFEDLFFQYYGIKVKRENS